MPLRSWPSASTARLEHQRRECKQHRHKHVHVRGQVQDAVRERGQMRTGVSVASAL